MLAPLAIDGLDAMTDSLRNQPAGFARKLVAGLLWTVGIAVVVVAAYLAFLGWDQHKDLDPVTQQETGPYEAWQVIGIGLVLTALALVAGWRRRVWPVVVALPIAITGCVAADWGSDADSDGLWVIGAALVFFVSLGGTVVLALLGAVIGARGGRGARRAGVPPASQQWRPADG
jgi:hypothetical protein